MRASCLQENLSRGLAIVGRAVASRPTLPVLSHILISTQNGQLKLVMGQHRGEIHFVGGEVYEALFDQLQGEEAFFRMLRFREGTFVLNPSFRAEIRRIEMTSEMLLLEGMRRIDEDSR